MRYLYRILITYFKNTRILVFNRQLVNVTICLSINLSINQSYPDQNVSLSVGLADRRVIVSTEANNRPPYPSIFYPSFYLYLSTIHLSIFLSLYTYFNICHLYLLSLQLLKQNSVSPPQKKICVRPCGPQIAADESTDSHTQCHLLSG